MSRAASDPLIWEQHLNKERGTPEGFAPYIADMLQGGGMLVARRGDAVIGMSRFSECPEAPGRWATGYSFLVRAEWGGTTNKAMKSLMLKPAFQTEPAVYFHIAEDNLRTQHATAKLGAVRVSGRGPGNAAQRWELTKSGWSGAS
ncbi:MAG: GNAT family N-acetyltransferase [Rhodobacteraceae bacterium]|nr:GNAT family N-acetyltransferase [Paracoccaceae bacterium]